MHMHLTHPQFLRALALARAHHHGWASEFDALGIDPQHRCETLDEFPPHCSCGLGDGGAGHAPSCPWKAVEFSSVAGSGRLPTPKCERTWQRTRREKLAGTNAAELEVLQRVEMAWAVLGEVADADLRTLTLMGTDQDDPGICSPGLDQDGDTSHETGSGRLEWLVRRDGSALLNVCRPGAELFRIRVSARSGRFGGWYALDAKYGQPVEYLLSASRPGWQGDVERVLRAVGADQPLSRAAAEAFIAAGEQGALTEALCAEGFTVASRLPGDPEATPEVQALVDQMDLLLELDPAGRESITVLSAEVGLAMTTREYADGTPATTPGHGYAVTCSPLAVTRETRGPGAELFWRHVETMRSALSGLGVEWDPQLEVV